jgi:hypothetical protein
MPKIYRVMEAEGEQPKVGPGRATLGVRLPGSGATIDIQPDGSGQVAPDTGGMSVAPSLRDLPYFLIPRRLKHLVRQASGNDKHRVWRMGEGPFISGLVSASLQLRVDPDNDEHGFIEPDRIMPLPEYEQGLADTRPLWRVDEA